MERCLTQRDIDACEVLKKKWCTIGELMELFGTNRILIETKMILIGNYYPIAQTDGKRPLYKIITDDDF